MQVVWYFVNIISKFISFKLFEVCFINISGNI